MKKCLLLPALFGSFWSAAQTFSNPNPIQVTDFGSGPNYPSEIQVSGLPPFLHEFSVRFAVAHSVSLGEVDIVLEAPNGQQIVLMSDWDFPGPLQFLDLRLGTSSIFVADSANILTLNFRPTNFGSGADDFPPPGPGLILQPAAPDPFAFQDLNPNGTWKLYVIDDEPNTSLLQLPDGWQLNLQAGDLPACKHPGLPQIEAVTDSTVTVSWTTGASNLACDFVVSFLGVTELPPSTPPTFSGLTQNLSSTFGGLYAGQDYVLFIRSDCGNGNVSSWKGPVDFQTPFTFCYDAPPVFEGCDWINLNVLQPISASIFWSNLFPFSFTPTHSGDFWIQIDGSATEPPAFQPAGNCDPNAWILADSDQSQAKTFKLPNLLAGQHYHLVLRTDVNQQVDQKFRITSCPLPQLAAWGESFTDSIALHFSNLPAVADSILVDVFWGLAPLAVPDAATLPTISTKIDPNSGILSFANLLSASSFQFYIRKNCGSDRVSCGWQGPFIEKTFPFCARISSFEVDTVTYSWADLRFRWDELDSMPTEWRLRVAETGADPSQNFEDDTYFPLRSEQDSVLARVQNIGLWRPLKVWLQAECGAEKQPWQGPFDLPAGKTPPIRIHEIFCGEGNSTAPDSDHQDFSLDGVYGYAINFFDIPNPCYSVGGHSRAEKLFRYRANKTGSVSIVWNGGGGPIGAGDGFFVKSAATVPSIQGWQHVGCWRVSDSAWPPPPLAFNVQKDSTYYLVADAFDWPNSAGGFGFLIDSCEVKCPSVKTLFKKSSTPTSIVLGWNDAAPGGKYVIEHQVDFGLDTEFFETTDTFFEITGLDPYYQQAFTVRPFCADGEAGPQFWNSFELSQNQALQVAEANRCNPHFLPPNGLQTVSFEAVGLEISADGDYFLYANQPQLFVYEGPFDPKNPAQNLRAARVGAENSGPKDTTLFLQAGQKLTLVAASEKFRKAISKPEKVRFFASSGPVPATFGGPIFSKKEYAAHGHVAHFSNLEYLHHNLACPDSSGWLNLYLANPDEPDIHADRLLLSLKGYEQPEMFNTWLKLTVGGAPGASKITNPPAAFVQNQSGWWELNRYWNISFLNQEVPQINLQPSQPVAVRYYYTEQDFQNLKGEIEASGGQLTAHEDLIFSKINGTHLPKNIAPWFGHPSIPAAATFAATFGFWPFSNGPEATTETWRHGFFDGEHFAEMKVRWFSGGGGGSTQNGNLPTDPTVKTTDFSKKEPAFRLFPNPTSGDFRLEWQGFLIEKGQLEIISSVGQTLRKSVISDGSASIDVEVGDLPEGIYFVKISLKGRLLKALKFVKQ